MVLLDVLLQKLDVQLIEAVLNKFDDIRVRYLVQSQGAAITCLDRKVTL